jgi:hypothetical protein
VIKITGIPEVGGMTDEEFLEVIHGGVSLSEWCVEMASQNARISG